MKAFNINTRNKMNTLKQQAGMTLTESLLVLSVGALVAVLAYGGYKMATSDVKAQSQTKATVQLVGKIKQVFGSGTDFTTVTATNVVNANIVPADFKVDSSGATPVINTAWGGSVVPTQGNESGTTATSSFRLVINTVPAEGCVDFLAGIASSATSLWMDGTTTGTNDIKPANGTFHADRAATQCKDGGTVTLVAQ